MNTDEIFERAEHYCVLASQDPETYGDAYVYWNTKAQSLENQGWKR